MTTNQDQPIYLLGDSGNVVIDEWQETLSNGGKITTDLIDNVEVSFSMRSAGPNRAERRKKKRRD